MSSAPQSISSADQNSGFTGLELRCPPLPQTLTEALEMMQRPERLDVAAVTAMVERDPVVVARLLNIVNSAYYGLRHQVTSGERAVSMLGPLAVVGIVVGMQMLKLRELLEGPAGACFHRLSRHSVATAFISRHLIEASPLDPVNRRARAGTCFTAGLLHDFGKIILVYNHPEKAAALYDGGAFGNSIRAADDLELEQLVFGYDHAEAGEYVARKLNFPDLLVEVVRHHHNPEAETGSAETDRLVRAVAAGNIISAGMGYASEQRASLPTVGAHRVWDVLVEHDFPSHTPKSLVAEVLERQEALDEYVDSVISAPVVSIRGGHSAPR